jgi:hypothetical protein
MFMGCSNLNKITMLAINISAVNCLVNWMSGVASSGTFVKNSNMTSLSSGTSGIPDGWTVVNDGEESGGNDYHSEYFTIEALEDGTISMETPSGTRCTGRYQNHCACSVLSH